MSDKTKTIELLLKLQEAFPNDTIEIRQNFWKFPHNKSIDVCHAVYIKSVGHSDDLYGMVAVENYVNSAIKAKETA